jgi:hypothetical protein
VCVCGRGDGVMVTHLGLGTGTGSAARDRLEPNHAVWQQIGSIDYHFT